MEAVIFMVVALSFIAWVYGVVLNDAHWQALRNSKFIDEQIEELFGKDQKNDSDSSITKE